MFQMIRLLRELSILEYAILNIFFRIYLFKNNVYDE